MDQKLKERLLGAVIILSVLIMVLPVLFRPPPEEISEGYFEESVEEKPSNPISLALDNHLLKERPSKPIMPLPPGTTKTVESRSLERMPAKVWVLRIGIFSHPHNAKTLVEKLRAKGYPAYSKMNTQKGMCITRVFVGPKRKEEDIKKIRDHLKKEFHLEGLALFIKTSELGVG